MRAYFTTLLCALWLLFFTGCQDGYTSTKESPSALASKTPLNSQGSAGRANSPYDLSGNGEGYGGIVSGNYYAFSSAFCDRVVNNVGRTPAYLKSILDKSVIQGVLTTDLCQEAPTQTLVPDTSIFSATHNSNILLLESGDVFERHASEHEAGSARQLQMFCRGKRVFYGGDIDSIYGLHYQQGIQGFRTGPLRDELWVDFIVRHKKSPTAVPGLVDGVYDGELVFESVNSFGYIENNALKDFNVDHWIRSSKTNDYLSEFGLLRVDPNTNTEEIFFQGKMTMNLPNGISIQADMVCTKGIK